MLKQGSLRSSEGGKEVFLMCFSAGAHDLCTVKSDLKEVAEWELELKNKRCWQGKRYYLALFTIRVIVGPADLKFELVSNFPRRSFETLKYSRLANSFLIEPY